MLWKLLDDFFSDDVSLGARALLPGELCSGPLEQWTVEEPGLAREIPAVLHD